MSYARVNGTDLYFEQHGSGEPVVLLHGGFGAGELFAPLLPQFEGRTVITVDLAGHGHSPDPDRPLRPETLADDVAALIEHLGLAPVDLLGYSLGGLTALRVAIQHPHAIRRLVLVSVAARRGGSFPEVRAEMDALSVAAAEPMKQAPIYALYARSNPHPENWALLVERTAEFLKVDYDWMDDVAELAMPVLLVYADADSIVPTHMADVYAALGGGLHDATWDGSQRPVNQLAVLPGTTHYDIALSPALVPLVLPFLSAA